MMRLTRFFTVFAFVVLCTGVTTIAQETITLTTYYPAPYGRYDELQATKLAVGSSATIPSNDGDIQADGDISAADITATGTIRANSGFNLSGTTGATETYTVITNVRRVGVNVQVKGRIITVQGGIITNVTNESGWRLAPL